LLAAAVVPQTEQRHYFGTLNIAPSYHSSTTQAVYLQGTGDVHLDLSSYYSTPRPAFSKHKFASSFGEVSLLVLSGNVTVTLPRDEYAYIDAATAGGHITTVAGQRVDNAYYGSVAVDGYTNDAHAIRELEIDVHALHGNITFVEQGASK
jgi:hypothetical protein